MGSILIGLVLVGVVIFLATEVKSLLIGESADPVIEASAREIIQDHRSLEKLLNIITVQQGPGEVMVALKVGFSSKLTSDEVSDAINAFEASLRARRPEVKWIFIEPDITRTSPQAAMSA